jgi:serralysin
LAGGLGGDHLDGGAGIDTASYANATGAVGASLWNRSSNTGEAKGDTFASIENLVGSRFSDRLEGNTASNILEGGAGDDRLYGGSGADHLFGGTGGDTFIFKKVSESTVTTRDTIAAFTQSAGDKISFSAIDANTNLTGNQAFTFIGAAVFHEQAGELRYEKVSGVTLVHGDVDGDGKADLSIKINAFIDFFNSDFVL